MPTTYIAIASTTVGAGGASNVTFSSIPQTYTDLIVMGSARSVSSGSGRIRINYNNASDSAFSTKVLWGTGAGAGSFSETGSQNMIASPYSMANDTANTFTNFQIYIPNYASSKYKNLSSDAVKENNTSTITNYEGMNFSVGIWASASAITTLVIGSEGGNLTQYSTFTLYGIKNS